MVSSRRESVGAFIFVDGKLLLLRRSARNGFLPGHYDIPGGKVEAGESLTDALDRELQEETGLRISSAVPFQSVEYVNGKGVHITETHFLATLASPLSGLQLSDEHDAFTLATRDDFASLLLSDAMRAWCAAAFEKKS